ncbi:MAG: DUF2227 family putative metal-binding protein [Chloracidobacterium sp.]|nr:DUF2227 family putative metal-binding protein [Chloracidobacterium sp.]
MPGGSKHDAITIDTVSTGDRDHIWRSVAADSNGDSQCGFLVWRPDVRARPRHDLASYSRWSVFRIIWFPYRHFFKHRSRFSHGLLFGALFRVIYFLGWQRYLRIWPP